MTSAWISLKKPPLYGNGQSSYRNLPEAERANLGLSLGRGFKTLGGLQIMQINEALTIILRVGLCQSYTLQRNSETVFEESLPVDSTAARVFYLWVAFKESYSDNVLPGPALLTEEELGELAQRIGEDLDILRSLDEDQMKDVLNRIYKARYLHDYTILPAIDFVNIDLDAPITGSNDSANAANEHPTPVNFDDFLISDGPETEAGNRDILGIPNNTTHTENTPEVAESERVMSFETSSTEINAVSCYPTPSSDGLDSPRPQKMPTRSDFPRTSDHRRVNGRNIQRQRKKAGARIKLDPIAKALLKGYNSELNDEAIRKVLTAEACFLPPNLQTLRSLSDQWHNNVSQGRHALGLPTEWVGIQAAWNYVKELEAKTLDPVAENVAYLLFHFNYKELCKRPKKYCPRPPNTHERSTTHVLNCIIEAAYPDDGFRGLEGEQLRRQLGYIIRKGQWCWQVVASLGSGVLLRGEWLDKMYNETFSAACVDALVTYISNVRPGTTRLFRSLEPTMKTLMFGRLPDFIKVFRTSGNDLQDQLCTASTEDEKAWATQVTESRWDQINARQIAKERISDFSYLTQRSVLS